jgi:hypothetical protein
MESTEIEQIAGVTGPEGRSIRDACNDYYHMENAFTIMQIGDSVMDCVYDEAIDPAIRSAGLAPRRVDRHNEGDLLKSEIVKFIETSQIIVADITNERPNCYLEIGYAMGLGKKKHLILTARGPSPQQPELPVQWPQGPLRS